jgi:hypothetical protein
MNNDKINQEFWAEDGLVKSVYPNAIKDGLTDMGITPAELGRRAHKQMSLNERTVTAYVNRLRKGNHYMFPHPQDMDEGSIRDLNRLSIILDCLGIQEESTVVQRMRFMYADKFVYPPRDNLPPVDNPSDTLIGLLPELREADARRLLRNVRRVIDNYD